MDRGLSFVPDFAAGEGRPGRARRILLVEDHEDTLAYLRRYLESNGHAVTIARTAADARLAANVCLPDILLCDITLPDGDGCQLLADLAELRPALCVAMSGHGMKAEVARCRDAGFHRHLTKPFLPDDLDAVLKLA
ncbi:MAG TPA: response regulator [Chthoniobacterales bacterium]|jgi:CheY-like chemotaxis protein